MNVWDLIRVAVGFMGRHRRPFALAAVLLLLVGPLPLTGERGGLRLERGWASRGWGCCSCGSCGTRPVGNERERTSERKEAMTTATATLDNRMGTEQPGAQPRRTGGPGDRRTARQHRPGSAEPNVAQAVHDARRLRQAGDLDGALASLRKRQHRKRVGARNAVGVRRVGEPGAAAVRGPERCSCTAQGTGRAAVLAPCGQRRDAGSAGRARHALAAGQMPSRGGACAG